MAESRSKHATAEIDRPEVPASILLVDDDPDIRSAVKEFLHHEGFTVVPAPNGADALNTLRTGFRPNVIVLDIMMPVMDGWDFRAAQLADPGDPTHAHADQLRQRVAFALSEVMVVSDRNAALLFQPWALATYYDMLARNAFGNFRTLLKEVSLSPTMGKYLDNVFNRKATATTSPSAGRGAPAGKRTWPW